ncbi:anaerobic ribonucleoside-triphosphate reductase activating protein [bacterium]|nr:anaerobic ribonucleoside-triphosphate reductase activating protein [bacterium]
MVFGGLQKQSLIDFPEKISCVLFLSGCNFECPYCHNPELVRGTPGCSPVSEEAGVYDFLEKRKTFLDGVVISGGEPTLNEDLPSLCKRIKQMGYPVKLDTNGSRPQVIQGLLEEGLVDYVAMDIKTDPSNYGSLVKYESNPDLIFQSIHLIMAQAPAYEFRTTCVKPMVDANIIETIATNIQGAMLYALQRFHSEEVLNPAFFHDPHGAYAEEEMMDLKSIATPWVRKCIVR